MGQTYDELIDDYRRAVDQIIVLRDRASKLEAENALLVEALKGIKHQCEEEIESCDTPTSDPTMCPFYLIEVIDEIIAAAKGEK